MISLRMYVSYIDEQESRAAKTGTGDRGRDLSHKVESLSHYEQSENGKK